MWREWHGQYPVIIADHDFQRLSRDEQRMILSTCDAAVRERRPISPDQILGNYLSQGDTGVGPRPKRDATGAMNRAVRHPNAAPREVVIQPPVARYDGSPVFALRLSRAPDVHVHVLLPRRTQWVAVAAATAPSVPDQTATASAGGPPRGVLVMVRKAILTLAAPVGARIRLTQQGATPTAYAVTSRGLESSLA